MDDTTEEKMVTSPEESDPQGSARAESTVLALPASSSSVGLPTEVEASTVRELAIIFWPGGPSVKPKVSRPKLIVKSVEVLNSKVVLGPRIDTMGPPRSRPGSAASSTRGSRRKQDIFVTPFSRPASPAPSAFGSVDLTGEGSSGSELERASEEISQIMDFFTDIKSVFGNSTRRVELGE